MRLLFQRRTPLTAYGVAQRTGLSTPTAKKYLSRLVRSNVLVSKSINKGAGLKKSTTIYGFNVSILRNR